MGAQGPADPSWGLNISEEDLEESREEMRVRTDCGYRKEPLAVKAEKAWEAHQIFYDNVPDAYQYPEPSRGGEAR